MLGLTKVKPTHHPELTALLLGVTLVTNSAELSNVSVIPFYLQCQC